AVTDRSRALPSHCVARAAFAGLRASSRLQPYRAIHVHPYYRLIESLSRLRSIPEQRTPSWFRSSSPPAEVRIHVLIQGLATSGPEFRGAEGEEATTAAAGRPSDPAQLRRGTGPAVHRGARRAGRLRDPRVDRPRHACQLAHS